MFVSTVAGLLKINRLHQLDFLFSALCCPHLLCLAVPEGILPVATVNHLQAGPHCSQSQTTVVFCYVC